MKRAMHRELESSLQKGRQLRGMEQNSVLSALRSALP